MFFFLIAHPVVFLFAFLFTGGHGGFYGNATGNYTLDSNFTGISDGAGDLNRAIEQYVGSYALNTLGKTQKVFSRKISLLAVYFMERIHLTT